MLKQLFKRRTHLPAPDPRREAFAKAMQQLGHPIDEVPTEQVLNNYLNELTQHDPHLQLQNDADLLAVADCVGVTR